MKYNLPGLQAQMKMAPAPLDGKISNKKIYKTGIDTSDSGVILLLYPSENHSLEIVLTLRTNSIAHGGQISLPGGLAEAGETPEETALREMNEEIGVPEKNVRVVGNLTKLYLDRSDNLITPVVGTLQQKPEFRINPYEVEEVFSVNLRQLTEQNNLVREPWTLRDQTYEVPYWNIHRKVPLWGATAMILSEFLELYREYTQQNDQN